MLTIDGVISDFFPDTFTKESQCIVKIFGERQSVANRIYKVLNVYKICAIIMGHCNSDFMPGGPGPS